MEKPKENRADVVWDCGSSLYDSFELNSFKRQLDSAISSRSVSMPHLSDRRVNLAPKTLHLPQPAKKQSKISRSINRLLRSIFKTRYVQSPREGAPPPILVVYDKSGALTTIPEAPEIDFAGFSPEIASLVTRTGSERFVATSSIGISCA